MGSPACEASDALSPCAGLLARHRASSKALSVMLFEPGGATRPRRGPPGGEIATAGLLRSKLISACLPIIAALSRLSAVWSCRRGSRPGA